MNDPEVLSALGQAARDTQDEDRQQTEEAERLLAELGLEAVSEEQVEQAVAKLPSATSPSPSAANDTVAAPAAPSRRGLVLLLSSVFAAAAAVLFFLRPATPEVTYELLLRAGDKEYRGEHGAPEFAPLRLSPGSLLELTLRPSSSVTDTSARLALRSSGGSRLLPARPERSREGALRFRGTLEEMLPGVTAGSHALLVLVGPEKLLPSRDQDLPSALATQAIQRFERDILLQP